MRKNLAISASARVLTASLLVGAVSPIALAQSVEQDAETEATEPTAAVEEVSASPEAEADETGEEDIVIVTGSSIRRSQNDQALPVTIFSKTELETSGITTPEQLFLQLNVASNSNDNLASNAGIVGGEERGNNGASSANLRQQGAASTLVLLNGRRVATHGFKGRSVDLNSIPFSAIERVEILRDGASAIYGTDAIGGVVNFILRKNFEGIEASGFYDKTEAGEGDIFRASVVGGYGDIDTDGWNVVGSLSYRNAGILKGVDRDFTNTFQPDRGLSPDTRGAPFASIEGINWGGATDGGVFNANNPESEFYQVFGNTDVQGRFVDPESGEVDPDTGEVDPDTRDRHRTLNVLALPGQPGCDAIEGMGVDTGALWNRPQETRSCAWDYPRAAVLQQPVENFDLVTRATYALNADTEIFAEFLGSYVTSKKQFEPNQITPWAIGLGDWATHGGGAYPSTGADYDYVVNALIDYYGADQVNNGAPINYRWRCIECGPREIDTETTAFKIQTGIDGVWQVLGRDFDYRVGLSWSQNDAESVLGRGYFSTEGLAELIGTGVISPFVRPGQSQTAEGMARLDALVGEAEGLILFTGKTTLAQFDATLSGDSGFNLGLGAEESVLFAAGVDFRIEGYNFEGDRRPEDNRPEIYQAPFDNGNAIEDASRDIYAVFGEVVIPVLEPLEFNLAGRYDHYSGFGGTFNPKYSARFTPFESLLFRGAYSTGFRIPTFDQLFNAAIELPYSGQDLADPRDCPGGIVDDDDPDCQILSNLTIISGGKEDLDPEESTQKSLGVVWTPDSSFQFNMDWWEITTDGTIRVPRLRELRDNYDLYVDNFIRDAAGDLTAIDQRFINVGERITEGIEFGSLARFEVGNADVTINFNGSYLITDRRTLTDTAPLGPNEVGTHSRGNIPLRWKHTIGFEYATDDWVHTVTQIYRDGYEDEVPPGIASERIFPENYSTYVDNYIVHNYSVTYSGIDDVDVTLGIRNVFDEDPPFTAHQNDFSPGAAFDPRVADPRGRAYTASLRYRF